MAYRYPKDNLCPLLLLYYSIDLLDKERQLQKWGNRIQLGRKDTQTNECLAGNGHHLRYPCSRWQLLLQLGTWIQLGKPRQLSDLDSNILLHTHYQMRIDLSNLLSRKCSQHHIRCNHWYHHIPQNRLYLFGRSLEDMGWLHQCLLGNNDHLGMYLHPLFQDLMESK